MTCLVFDRRHVDFRSRGPFTPFTCNPRYLACVLRHGIDMTVNAKSQAMNAARTSKIYFVTFKNELQCITYLRHIIGK